MPLGVVAERSHQHPFRLCAVRVAVGSGTRNGDVSDQRRLYSSSVTCSDIIDGVKKALGTVDPTPFFAKYGNNVWAASQQYLAAVVAYASGPVIKKYLGVLAAADVYTASTTFAILESIRLDLGFGSQVHP